METDKQTEPDNTIGCTFLGIQKNLKYCVTGSVQPVFFANKQMKQMNGVESTLHRDATTSSEENKYYLSKTKIALCIGQDRAR